MSYPFKKILCPVQFDDSEQVSLDLASRLAKDMDATVYLLHVVPILAVDAPDITVSADTQAEDKARLRLQALAAERTGRTKVRSDHADRQAGRGRRDRAPGGH